MWATTIICFTVWITLFEKPAVLADFLKNNLIKVYKYKDKKVIHTRKNIKRKKGAQNDRKKENMKTYIKENSNLPFKQI